MCLTTLEKAFQLYLTFISMLIAEQPLEAILFLDKVNRLCDFVTIVFQHLLLEENSKVTEVRNLEVS